MSTAEPVLRPGPTGIKRLVSSLLFTALPYLAAFFRRYFPIARLGSKYVLTRHDDVREAMQANGFLKVPYATNLKVLLDNQPCFVGMGDTPEYWSQLDRLHSLMEPGDMVRLAAAAEEQAEAIVAAADGSLEVVDGLFRAVTFKMLQDYFGVPNPPNGDMRVWSTRLFEYQFMPHDDDLVAQTNRIAPALRSFVDAEIARRRQAGSTGDDLLARALRKQAQDPANWDDVFIRTMLCALIIGGPPQPPMVLPQALEQLLRRPTALAGAVACAQDHDQGYPLLLGHILEALRFDPISPWLPRDVIEDFRIAEGASRQKTLAKGKGVLVVILSAMADPRRIPDPKTFDPNRQPYQYLHFGFGLHECFGEPINRATFAPMMAPLLRQPNLRRAPGKAGHLAKAGFFPSALSVRFG